MYRSLTFLLFLLFASPLLAQEYQFDLENPYIIQPDEIGQICTLDPTDINAHYYISSDEIRSKIGPAVQTADFEINFQSNCQGQQWPQDARTALEFATEIWAEHLESPIPIRISANWIHQDGNVLGSASPTAFFTLTSAGIPNTAYTVSHASALIAQDIVAGNDNLDADMIININCNFDDWYFGTDANTPSGLIDFVTVALHEIGHGIGFLGTVGANNNTQLASSGFNNGEIPYIYELFAIDGFFNNKTDRSIFPNNSRALYDLVTGRNDGLFFDGAEAELANDAASQVQIYAPLQFQPGSSFSHVDHDTFTNTENALMRPFADRAFAIHNPGPVFCGILEDMEWPLGAACIAQLADEELLRKPFLAEPFNNVTDQPEENIVFTWNPVNNADEYQLQLSDDFIFSDIIYDQVIADTVAIPDFILEKSNTYFWRVRGLNILDDGAWSNTWSFSTIEEAPDAVVLIFPPDGEVNLMPGDFALQWEQAERANQYQVQVSEESDFSDPVIDNIQSSTSFGATGTLEFSTMYFWRVRGINQGGEGEWSEIRTFTTIIERPEAVTLISPADGEGQVSVTPQFSWTESARAEEYIIQISPEEDFSDLITEATTEETTFNPAVPLEHAAIYFWRVMAINIGGESDWSSTWSFTTVVLETLVENNYPNPFSMETTIRYQLSRQTDVLLDVYDILGRRIMILVNEEQEAGVYFVPLNAAGMASGTYLIRFVADDVNNVQKMTLVK